MHNVHHDPSGESLSNEYGDSPYSEIATARKLFEDAYGGGVHPPESIDLDFSLSTLSVVDAAGTSRL
jgi:hypothetical protein